MKKTLIALAVLAALSASSMKIHVMECEYAGLDKKTLPCTVTATPGMDKNADITFLVQIEGQEAKTYKGAVSFGSLLLAVNETEERALRGRYGEGIIMCDIVDKEGTVYGFIKGSSKEAREKVAKGHIKAEEIEEKEEVLKPIEAETKKSLAGSHTFLGTYRESGEPVRNLQTDIEISEDGKMKVTFTTMKKGGKKDVDVYTGSIKEGAFEVSEADDDDHSKDCLKGVMSSEGITGRKFDDGVRVEGSFEARKQGLDAKSLMPAQKPKDPAEAEKKALEGLQALKSTAEKQSQLSIGSYEYKGFLTGINSGKTEGLKIVLTIGENDSATLVMTVYENDGDTDIETYKGVCKDGSFTLTEDKFLDPTPDTIIGTVSQSAIKGACFDDGTQKEKTFEGTIVK